MLGFIYKRLYHVGYDFFFKIDISKLDANKRLMYNNIMETLTNAGILLKYI